MNDTETEDDDVPAFDVSDSAESSEAAAPAYVRELVPERAVKDSTRKLFAELGTKMRDGEMDVDDDGLVPASLVPSAAPGGQTAAAPAAPQVSSPPIPPGAAPTLDAAAKAANDQASAAQAARESAFAERERKLVEREQAVEKRANLASRYAEAPGSTLLDLIKEFTGVEGEDLRDEVADIISELSAVGLGVPLPEAHKNRVESKKALRTVKQYKAEAAKLEADRSAREQAAQQEQAERAAVADVGRELTGAAAKYPHLMAADGDPAQIVWSVIRAEYAANQAHYDSTRTAPDWQQAAALAEQHFQKQHDAWIAKRRHLLAPAAPSAPAPVAPPQGDPQSHRSSTPTNRMAAPVASAPSAPANGGEPEEFDRDAHRRRSLARLSQVVKERSK